MNLINRIFTKETGTTVAVGVAQLGFFLAVLGTLVTLCVMVALPFM